MADYTKELANDIAVENITVYRKYRDGEHYAYEAVANEGFVIYDETANDTELDTETMQPVKVTYYFERVGLPLKTNFVEFPFKAIPRSEADEKNIF